MERRSRHRHFHRLCGGTDLQFGLDGGHFLRLDLDLLGGQSKSWPCDPQFVAPWGQAGKFEISRFVRLRIGGGVSGHLSEFDRRLRNHSARWVRDGAGDSGRGIHCGDLRPKGAGRRRRRSGNWDHRRFYRDGGRCGTRDFGRSDRGRRRLLRGWFRHATERDPWRGFLRDRFGLLNLGWLLGRRRRNGRPGDLFLKRRFCFGAQIKPSPEHRKTHSSRGQKRHRPQQARANRYRDKYWRRGCVLREEYDFAAAGAPCEMR